MTAGRTINSQNTSWCTPKKIVDAVKDFFGVIHLDPCSNNYSIVDAEVKYILPQDGLKENWGLFRNIYVNPPYGKDKERKTSISNWIEKCLFTYENYNSEIIALIPVATNTSHWKKYIWNKATSICFLYDSRLKFIINGNEDNKGAPMSCCIVYWGKQKNKFTERFNTLGAVVKLQI